LADVDRDGCRWSDREGYSAGIPGQREVREGALVNDRGSFSIRSVSSLTEMSELGD
jgi:hypothetical protein